MSGDPYVEAMDAIHLIEDSGQSAGLIFGAQVAKLRSLFIPRAMERGTQAVARTPDGILWLYGGNQWRPSTPTEGEGLG